MHPTLRLGFLRGNKYHFVRCGANLLYYTSDEFYLCHDELATLSLPRPCIHPPWPLRRPLPPSRECKPLPLPP